MTLYEGITVFIAGISVVILSIQIYLAARTLRLDHERRKKEATINFMIQVRPLWHQGRRLIDEKWGKEELSEEALIEIDNDPKAHELVRTLLTHMELLSVGVNTGVYDKSLLRRMSGAYLARIYRRFKPYIAKMQQKQPSAYIEFENMVQEFQRLKISETG